MLRYCLPTCFLFLPLIADGTEANVVPERLQGSWELTLKWQMKDGAHKSLEHIERPTIYHALLTQRHLFMYQKELQLLVASELKAVDKLEGNDGIAFLSVGSKKSQIITISNDEVIFFSHGKYSKSGYAATRRELGEAKALLRNLVETNGFIVENRKLLLHGVEIHDFGRELDSLRDWGRFQVKPPRVDGFSFDSVIWFAGESELEAELRRAIQYKAEAANASIAEPCDKRRVAEPN